MANYYIFTSPPEGVARYCFHPDCLCVSVCLCVRPIFIGFVLNSLKTIDLHRSKVTGTVHCFLKVQSYHKNWAMENFQYCFVYTSLYALSTETIKTGASREMTSQKIRQYLTFNKNNLKNSHTAPSYSYSLSVCQMWWRSDLI